MARFPVLLHTRVAKEAKKHGMDVGPFVVWVLERYLRDVDDGVTKW